MTGSSDTWLVYYKDTKVAHINAEKYPTAKDAVAKARKSSPWITSGMPLRAVRVRAQASKPQET